MNPYPNPCNPWFNFSALWPRRRLMSALPQDLKFGLRMLVRKPLLTIGISLSLALGIGANSAVFSLVDAILFRPLNVGNPARLVSLYTSDYSGTHYGANSYTD